MSGDIQSVFGVYLCTPRFIYPIGFYSLIQLHQAVESLTSLWVKVVRFEAEYWRSLKREVDGNNKLVYV